MITADSSVWIDFLKGRPSAQADKLDAALADEACNLILLDVVLMEVLRGISNEVEYDQTYNTLMPLVVETAGGKDIAIAASNIYRNLRKNSITVRSSIDLMVAAWCLSHECELLHSDRDFEAIASFYPLQMSA